MYYEKVYVKIIAEFATQAQAESFAADATALIAGGVLNAEKRSKKGIKTVNLCEMVRSFSAEARENEVFIRTILAAGNTVNLNADLLFSSTFGGPLMSILIVFVPQVLVFSLLCTYIYRRTGNVYTGAFTVASMAAWIITGGSAML